MAIDTINKNIVLDALGLAADINALCKWIASPTTKPSDFAANVLSKLFKLALEEVAKENSSALSLKDFSSFCTKLVDVMAGKPGAKLVTFQPTSTLSKQVKISDGVTAICRGFSLKQSSEGIGITGSLALQVGDSSSPLIDDGSTGLSVQTVKITLSLQTVDNALKPYLDFDLVDVRLPLATLAGKVGGVLASLLPDGTGSPGFSYGFRVTNVWSPKATHVTIPVDEDFGPLSVRQVQLDIAKDSSFELGLDASLEVGGIKLSLKDFGIETQKGGDPALKLDGINIDFDTGAVRLTGQFQRSGTDYAGAARLGAFGFELAAMGGYGVKGNHTALFAFAALRAPLGGPPFFFVTGVAAGFGYNRGLELPKNISQTSDHKLLCIMRGELDDDWYDVAELFPIEPGAFWAAGGVSFNCFGFISGEALLYVKLNPFGIGILGSGRLSIPPLLMVEIGFAATIDSEKIMVSGGISPSSYMLVPGLRLQGDFVLAVWHARGDALFSLGGYYKGFKKPSYYPELNRVSCSVGLVVAHAKGSCYFAVTPREAMAGGRLDVWGTWGPASAGFYAEMHAKLGWDPFYIYADIGVGVWVELDLWLFSISAEFIVRLQMWAPPFGGRASVDVEVTTIEIDFGQPFNIDKLKGPSIQQFFSRQLRVPVKDNGANRYTLDNEILACQVTRGRTEAKNLGESESHAIPISQEFAFRITSKLPFYSQECRLKWSDSQWKTPFIPTKPASVDGDEEYLHLACGDEMVPDPRTTVESKITVSLLPKTGPGPAGVSQPLSAQLEHSPFPQAMYGSLAAKKMTRELCDEIVFSASPKTNGVIAADVVVRAELSEASSGPDATMRIGLTVPIKFTVPKEKHGPGSPVAVPQGKAASTTQIRETSVVSPILKASTRYVPLFSVAD